MTTDLRCSNVFVSKIKRSTSFLVSLILVVSNMGCSKDAEVTISTRVYNCDPPEHLECTSAIFEGFDLSYMNMSGAWLGFANLSGVNLEQTNLSYAKMSHAKLIRANLIGANLTGAEGDDVIFRNANLTGANLAYAYFSCNSSTDCWSGANLTDANLLGSNLLEGALNGAILTGATMPDGTIHE